jgi:GT2 family glycosyltransferase
MKHKVAIIIVNWNGKKDTLECLQSLQKISTFGNEVMIVVVDNNSKDGSQKEIHTAYPEVTILNQTKNLGFTGANNVGMRHAINSGSDFIWLLNNDTVVGKNVLKIIEGFSGGHIGVAGSKILFSSGHEYHKDRYAAKDLGKVLWYAGGIIDWKNMFASHRGVDEVDVGQYDTCTETDFVTGCSMMIVADVVKKVGYFDDRFFAYLEDLDYCLRVKQAGYRILYNPESVLWHKNAGSSGGSGSTLQQYYMERNRFIVGFRWAPLRTRFALLREALRVMAGSNQIRKKAITDFFLGRFGGQDEK